MTTIRAFFLQIRALFSNFRKRAGETFPPPPPSPLLLRACSGIGEKDFTIAERNKGREVTLHSPTELRFIWWSFQWLPGYLDPPAVEQQWTIWFLCFLNFLWGRVTGPTPNPPLFSNWFGTRFNRGVSYKSRNSYAALVYLLCPLIFDYSTLKYYLCFESNEKPYKCTSRIYLFR